MPYGVLSSLLKLLGIIHIDNYYLGSMSIDGAPYLNKKRLQHTYKSSSIYFQSNFNKEYYRRCLLRSGLQELSRDY